MDQSAGVDVVDMDGFYVVTRPCTITTTQTLPAILEGPSFIPSKSMMDFAVTSPLPVTWAVAVSLKTDQRQNQKLCSLRFFRSSLASQFRECLVDAKQRRRCACLDRDG